MKQTLLTIFSFAFLLTSCQEQEPAKTPEKQALYFDVPALVNTQINALNTKRPELKKTLSVSGKKPEIISLSPEDWKTELQAFHELDLNKKALGDAYVISAVSNKYGSTTIYTLKPGISTPVRQLEVNTNPQNQVTLLRAVCVQNNALFYSRELRELTFSPANTLSAYKITGVQKVALFDSLHYYTKGSIR